MVAQWVTCPWWDSEKERTEKERYTLQFGNIWSTRTAILENDEHDVCSRWITAPVFQIKAFEVLLISRIIILCKMILVEYDKCLLTYLANISVIGKQWKSQLRVGYQYQLSYLVRRSREQNIPFQHKLLNTSNNLFESKSSTWKVMIH